jgi:hypothetical protein
MISKKKYKWTWWQIFAGVICLASCQKDKDILERELPFPSPSVLTTVIATDGSRVSKDSIFWYQDQQGRIDSAYRYDSMAGKRYKAFQVDRSIPGMIVIDDGDMGRYSAHILFNPKKQPYKVIFFDRMTSTRLSNSYVFAFGGFSPYPLEFYMDSIYSSMTMEIYATMGPGQNYPVDSFEQIGTKLGSFLSEHIISANKRGPDLSSYSFVPFVSQVVTSNLADRTPSAIHGSLFDTYIWGEVLRPWLSKQIILSFDVKQIYPMTLPKYTNTYSAQVSPKKIIYSDGKTTVSNFYP